MRKTMIALLVAAVVVPAARANPAGAQIARGAALLSNPSASTMQIVNTPGTIINWQSFSIANGETVRFVQLNAASAVLNRVTGAASSAIAGRLESNGRVFLINPNGIVFGAGAVVDVAGLVASTRNITDANFLAGNYLFSGGGGGSITVQSGAQIVTSTYGAGGQVWLLAKNVTLESGANITAPGGQVVLAAGSEIQVGTNGLGQMSFTVATDGTSSVDSLGSIAADRGAVGLFADFVNHRGVVNAGTQGSVSMNAAKELRLKDGSLVHAPDGSITLRGGSLLEVEHDAIVNADGANGIISFESGNLLVFPSGNAHAAGGQVKYNQDGPSQYVAGTQLTLVATLADTYDRPAMVYRRADGNYAMRFARAVMGAPVFAHDPQSGESVQGYLEVVFDGRTGAIVSGPVPISLGSIEAGAINAARTAWNTAIRNRVDAFNESIRAEETYRATHAALVARNGDGSQTAAIQALNAAFRASSDAFSVENRRLTLIEYAAVESHYAAYVAFNALATSGPPRFQEFTQDGGSSAMTDGSRITYARQSYQLRGVDDAVRQSAPLPRPDFAAAIVPRANGGFSIVDHVPGAGHPMLWNFDKVAAAHTPTTPLTGAAGVSAALVMRPGLSNGVAAPVPPTPSPAPPPVVSGTGSGARFGGYAGCNSAVCDEEVRKALAVTEALIASQPAGDGTSRAEQQVNALLRAAGQQPDPAGAAAVAVLMVDNGELRRLVQGSRFDNKTPAERLAQIKRWLEAESLEQRLGEDTTDGNRVTLVTAVSLMDDEERIAYGAEIARLQLSGELPPAAEEDTIPRDPSGPTMSPEEQIDFEAAERRRLQEESSRGIDAPAGGRP